MGIDIKMTRTWAEIDLAAIRQNYNSAAAYASSHGAKMISVIKADAYGHGATTVASELEKYCSADFFAVATLPEAITLIESGIKSKILILSEIHPSLYGELVRYKNVIPSIFQLESARALSASAVLHGVTIPCFIVCDTGMSRIGIECTTPEKTAEGIKLVEEISELPNLHIDGIFSHLACADQYDKVSALHQITIFDDFIKNLTDHGIHLKYKSLCNSAALTEPEFTNKYDLVREGISLYGYYPSPETKRVLHLKPAMAVRTRITAIKTLPAGTGISYGHTYVTTRETRVATLPVGYADGYPRLLSNKAGVVIDDKYAPILGRVCMDQMMVDVTDIPTAKVDSIATLIGADERVRADKLAEMMGTISYELICGISSRVPRTYVNSYSSINSD
ncbi:MAG: alanine racemase [Clostridia bacterium]|nr:alanine racemase [Clostridia bacterium]